MMAVKTAALFLLICSSALADISACRDAFDKELYAAAIKECTPLAKAGNPDAQFILGLIYDNGDGVPKDAVQAVIWYRKAADQGIAGAQFNLGVMHFTGEGVPKDALKAVNWYRKAAEQGHGGAQGNLALMYNFGQGVPQDYKEAVHWYKLAAEQGNLAAQSNLGSMYDNGQGVPQDYVQAHMWFNLAGAAGSPFGVNGRDRVAAKMSPAQIADAQRLAREWKPKTVK